MLAAARRRFLEDYTKIRHAEGRRSRDPAYHLELPYCDITGRLQDQWIMLGRSYRYLERRVLAPIEARHGRPLRIADLGARNCWMSYRLSLGGHLVTAADIPTDSLYGLCAGSHYAGYAGFGCMNAEFDSLPVADASLDLAVYNASIHYWTDYRRTLVEAHCCLGREGSALTVDSPVYRRREHGEWMKQERHQQFEQAYGFRSDTLATMEYFDEEMLRHLEHDLVICWQEYNPWYGWRWALWLWKALWKRKRPAWRFRILVGRFAQ
jgi:ubiquinone/menaquinone biosynthesis C-methylase UbiE